MNDCAHSMAAWDELAECETCGGAMCFECSRYNSHKHYRDVHKWCERVDDTLPDKKAGK